jgi:hypothetical protein
MRAVRCFRDEQERRDLCATRRLTRRGWRSHRGRSRGPRGLKRWLAATRQRREGTTRTPTRGLHHASPVRRRLELPARRPYPARTGPANAAALMLPASRAARSAQTGDLCATGYQQVDASDERRVSPAPRNRAMTLLAHCRGSARLPRTRRMADRRRPARPTRRSRHRMREGHHQHLASVVRYATRPSEFG